MGVEPMHLNVKHSGRRYGRYQLRHHPEPERERIGFRVFDARPVTGNGGLDLLGPVYRFEGGFSYSPDECIAGKAAARSLVECVELVYAIIRINGVC